MTALEFYLGEYARLKNEGRSLYTCTHQAATLTSIRFDLFSFDDEVLPELKENDRLGKVEPIIFVGTDGHLMHAYLRWTDLDSPMAPELAEVRKAK